MLCNVKLFLAFEDLYGNMISFNTTSFDNLDILAEIDRAFTEKDYPNFFCRKKKKGYTKSHIHNLLRSIPDSSSYSFEPMKKVKLEPISVMESKQEENTSTLSGSKGPKLDLRINIPKGNELVEVEMKV